jgi:chorismate dehydratase
MNKKTEIVFAGAPYSNSAPLVDKLTEVDDRVRVMSDHPANLVQDLNAGRADVALIPVAHLFSHPELIMMPGLGVAADGPVQSVLLKCSVPVNHIRTVARDPASATSNALAELLLRRHYNRDIEIVEKEAADASVLIGDRALCSSPAPAGDIDLAEAWKEMTGLPFVFAVWAVRRDFQEIDEASTIAHKAYRAGLAALEEIAGRYADELGRSPAFWLDYLGRRIHYELGAREMEGLDLFRQLLAQDELKSCYLK